MSLNFLSNLLMLLVVHLVLQIGESVVGLMKQAWNLVLRETMPHWSFLDIGPCQFRPVTKMAAIFKMAAIAYLKFFDIVG